MAIDETITRPKSMIVSKHSSTMAEHEKSNIPVRMGHLLARKHRIERWAYKGRSSSISDTATITSAALGTVSAQKRSESSYTQSGRVLNIHLLQLSEQRQKAIERNNFDQKLFANKQALKYKDNVNVLRTLNYVRKCCKYIETTDEKTDNIDPTIFLEENSLAKRSRSRSPSATPPPVKRNLPVHSRTQTSASMAETFLQHNKKHLTSYTSSPLSRKLTDSKTSNYTTTMTNPSTTSVDDDSQKRHVQFRINSDGTQLTNRSVQVFSKTDSYHINKQPIRQVTSAHGIRSSNSSYDTRPINSAPLIRTIPSAIEHSTEEIKQSPKPKRSLSRINSARKAVEEFRLHPERFLSASNRYLPLLRRQALEAESKQQKQDTIKKTRIHFSPPISRLSDGSDLTYDDAKSFLSEEFDTRKYALNSQTPAWIEQERKTIKKLQPSNKIDMMTTVDDDDELERRMAIAHLRDREYSHLHDLIRSNPIEQILEPFSAIKTDDYPTKDNQKEKSYSMRKPSNDSTKIRQLNDILHSIDSLRCSDTMDRRARRQVDIEKNRAKLGILIF